jgi:hypothetical protein
MRNTYSAGVLARVIEREIKREREKRGRERER